MVKTQIQVKAQISNKEIWSIALPIMLGNMAQTIINFTDTAFLGHLGVVALGASMLAGLFYFVFTTIAAGFAVGIQIIIARRFGEKNYGRIGVIFEHGSLFVLVLGLLLNILFFLYGFCLLLLGLLLRDLVLFHNILLKHKNFLNQYMHISYSFLHLHKRIIP